MRIGIDLMGSENSPLALFEAVLKAAQSLSGVTFLVLALPRDIEVIQSQPRVIDLVQDHSSHFEFHPVNQVVEMEDDPLTSVREKKGSSLVVGLMLLKKHAIDGFVTTGNTGALIAGASLLLPSLGMIKRPALLANLPTKKGEVSILDVGGSVKVRSSHLIQFAQMGAAYQQCRFGVQCPRVGLLNVGVESKKGTTEIRKAYDQLAGDPSNKLWMQFVGNIEGRELFQGLVDVLITDGFAGNVLLKTAEGVSSFILEQLQDLLQPLSIEQKTLVFESLRTQFDYEEYMGAIVCGVDGVVVKCHGSSSAKGMFNAIKGAVELVRNQFIDKIKSQLGCN
ncbi:MAG: phosphate acyltransferase PlsX [Chlamydiales bacterium]